MPSAEGYKITRRRKRRRRGWRRRREGEEGGEGEKEECLKNWHSNDLRGQASWSKKTYWLWSFGFSMLGCCGIRHLIGTTYLLRIDRPNSYFAWPFHGQFPMHVLFVSCPQAQIFTYSTSTFQKLIWLKRFGQFWHRVADAGRLLAFLLRLPSPWDKLKLLLYWIVLEIEAE